MTTGSAVTHPTPFPTALSLFRTFPTGDAPGPFLPRSLRPA